MESGEVGGGGGRERGERRRRGEEGEREGRNRAEGRKKRKLVCPFLMIVTTCDCMKFYYSLLSLVLLPPSPDSMAPRRVVRMKRRTSSDVHFILGWPVTQGRRDREALTRPTASRHC